jgi:hypothetical protein
MALTSESLWRAMPLLKRLPDGTWFDTPSGSNRIEFQASSQAQVAAIRAALPGAIWRKEWNGAVKWWEYSALVCIESEEFQVRIYAVHEAPKTCRAITEKRAVTRDVPLTYRQETVFEDVIVGWNCGDEEASEHADEPEASRLPH